MNSLVEYDVVICGAGPAGCMAAINLDRTFKVLLIDRSMLPRDKSCAGMLKREAYELLKRYGLPRSVFSEPSSLTPRGIDISSGRELVSSMRYHSVDRNELDEWFLILTKDNPQVEVWDRSHLVSFSQNDDGVKVLVRREAGEVEISCRVLIGADGAGGVTGRLLCDRRPKIFTTLAETFPVSGRALKEFVGFIGGDIPYYHWVVPKGNRVQVGTAFPPGEGDIKMKFTAFKDMALEKLGIEQLGESALKGYPITMLESASEVCAGSGRVLLAGEAAGLIDSSLLEGITYALRSGELSAAAINSAPDDPLDIYKRSLAPVKRRLFWQLQINKIYRSTRLRLVAQFVMPRVWIERTGVRS